MIRFAGVVIPDKKHICVSLRKIYGIGKRNSKSICNNLDIPHYLKASQLSASQVESLRKELSNYVIEGDLRRNILMSIKRLIDVKCYRGIRHKMGLPVRGQSTKNNAKTIRRLSKLKKNV